MSEELFDVVNDQDEVLQTMPRSVVHRDRLLHRAIHVFVFRADGCMLIHRRSANKEEFPSVWTSSCSGHVSAGETYEESAPRELSEELGISAPLLWLRKFPAAAETSWEFTVLFQACCDSEITPDPQEMTAVQWLTVDAIRTWLDTSPSDFSPAFRLLFDWYFVIHNQRQDQR